MPFKHYNMLVIILFATVVNSDNTVNEDEDYDFMDIYVQNGSYHGEKFPDKYLSVEESQSTAENLTTYIKSLMRTVTYFANSPNDTDANVAIGLFFTKAVLKRSLLDYGDKINDVQKRNIKKLIHKAEYWLSHFIYDCFQNYDSNDLILQLSKLFKLDDSVVYSIAQFNKNMMRKWIRSNLTVNQYIEEMDNITLSRYKYVELVTSMDENYKISHSDFCIAGISSQPIPINIDVMMPCRFNKFCTDRVLKMPSSAYVLSHRLFYIEALYLTRRCYVLGEEVDKQHMAIMCANMYREAVYLARRGFFYRDLFLEHIALCGLLGYEEFYRGKWFKKVLSWMDDEGCMRENRNFELNRTTIYMSRPNQTMKTKKRLKKMRYKLINEECQHHQMALLMIVLAHAIRFTAHYL